MALAIRYLGHMIVEFNLDSDHEPRATQGMARTLAIYRSAARCDGRRCRRGEQQQPELFVNLRQPLIAPWVVAVGPRSVGYLRTFAAARIPVVPK